jgi:spermidine/putrescine transport system substrate-binding protein
VGSAKPWGSVMPVTRRRFIRGMGAATVVTGATLAGCGSASAGEVVVITWGDPEKSSRLGAAFKAETGITLRLVPGNDDADFYNKIRAGGAGQYDIVISNVGFAPLYHQAGLIEVLNLNDFAAAAEIYPQFRTDLRFNYLLAPNRSLVFPNQWGVYGLTYSTTAPAQPAQPISWQALWQAPKGKVMLDGFYVTNIALAGRMTGVPWADVFAIKGKDLDSAVRRLVDLKPFQLANAEQVAINDYLTGETYAGMVNSLGFAMSINRKAGRDVAVSVIPQEGVIGALDGQMLLKGARNRDNALRFINFLGGHQAQTIFWELYRGPTANRVATETILAKGGQDATLMKVQQGDQPNVAAAMTQLRQPDDPSAWNDAWDRVLAS